MLEIYFKTAVNEYSFELNLHYPFFSSVPIISKGHLASAFLSAHPSTSVPFKCILVSSEVSDTCSFVHRTQLPDLFYHWKLHSKEALYFPPNFFCPIFPETSRITTDTSDRKTVLEALKWWTANIPEYFQIFFPRILFTILADQNISPSPPNTNKVLWGYILWVGIPGCTSLAVM